MTAVDLLRFQLDDAAFQLEKVLEGLAGDQWDRRSTASSKSAREIVGHLAEAYHACAANAIGQEYKWGSWSLPSEDIGNLWESMLQERSRATAGTESEDQLHHIYEYVVAHDLYHVGQLATIRLLLDPNWNPYSIYR